MALTIEHVEACPLLYWHELSDEQESEFDYLDTPERQQGTSFVLYRDAVYDTAEFMWVGNNSPFPKPWEGYQGDSFFSGVLIMLADDGDIARMATYYS